MSHFAPVEGNIRGIFVVYMNWPSQIHDRVRHGLRVVIGAMLLVNGVLLALASVWLVARLLWQILNWADRVLFSRPW